MVTVSGEWSCFSSRQIEYNRIPGSNASDIVFTMARILMCSLCGIDVLSQIPPMQPGLSNAPQHHKWIVQSCHRIYCMWFQHHFSSGRLVIQTERNIFFFRKMAPLSNKTLLHSLTTSLLWCLNKEEIGATSLCLLHQTERCEYLAAGDPLVLLKYLSIR